ncbi:MAG: hypothetical protein J5822_03385 [Eubacteriaceae bacterium]|nr:hypothetical protein [Eubacteriaceae bacterium]
MAFCIGGARSIDDIDADAFRRAASEAGIGERVAMRRFDAMAGMFADALSASAEELFDMGYPGVRDIRDRILRFGGYGSITHGLPH